MRAALLLVLLLASPAVAQDPQAQTTAPRTKTVSGKIVSSPPVERLLLWPVDEKGQPAGPVTPVEVAHDGAFRKEVRYAPFYRIGIHPACVSIEEWQVDDDSLFVADAGREPGASEAGDPGTTTEYTVHQRSAPVAFFLGDQTKYTVTTRNFDNLTGSAFAGIGKFGAGARVQGGHSAGGVLWPEACSATKDPDGGQAEPQ